VDDGPSSFKPSCRAENAGFAMFKNNMQKQSTQNIKDIMSLVIDVDSALMR
jgi:hypothetical protein